MNLTIEVRAKPENFHELYQTLQAILPTIRSVADCRECRIYEDVENSNIFYIDIDCLDQEKLENIMQSMGGTALIGALNLLAESVKVKLDSDSVWSDIETLKRLRKKT